MFTLTDTHVTDTMKRYSVATYTDVQHACMIHRDQINEEDTHRTYVVVPISSYMYPAQTQSGLTNTKHRQKAHTHQVKGVPCNPGATNKNYTDRVCLRNTQRATCSCFCVQIHTHSV